jgi:hypothetical protein
VQSRIFGICDQERLALLRHIRNIPFAWGLLHAEVDGGISAAAGDEAKPSSIEEPEMNGLASKYRSNLHRDESDYGIEIEGGVERLLEIVELRHAMDGVEEVVTLLLKILCGQESG